ncbi:hypothetical protein LS482_12100 [Sinomicrobium kalidii]|uniref:hypothetical protein n=1 Tax=Sinomicrobium kalidii TaxID=2900738 RepID=UPI001E47DA76|nr:hypothetical protein [Sinomicrobium kalidii]UGU14443.1 hypothetical protein LS482_12100 [Sinomicrobium kalidii]
MEWKTKVFDKLQERAYKHFDTLKYNAETDDFEVKIYLSGYVDLACTIADLLNLCIIATEKEATSGELMEDDMNNSINNILRLTFRMLPVSESMFLNEAHCAFIYMKEKAEQKRKNGDKNSDADLS